MLTNRGLKCGMSGADVLNLYGTPEEVVFYENDGSYLLSYSGQFADETNIVLDIVMDQSTDLITSIGMEF
ncbi:hypothetical protein LJC33_07660 [Eubacteriales bacterium OttesenSCG-928-N13]|nr:hypothetical protein [Eubacteriales bacterium OttesenSCG-928-N13]